MTQSTTHPKCIDNESYELPLRDHHTKAKPCNKDVDNDFSPTSHTSTHSSFSMKRRRRMNSSNSNLSLSSSGSCGIHLSSLSLSSMSSSDTNHCWHDFEQGRNVTPSVHCESFTKEEPCTNNCHQYQIFTNDYDDDNDDAPAVCRLSKRHRAYTNLTALCSSTSLTIVGKGSGQNSCNTSCWVSDDHTATSDDSDDGWGYFVDTL
jgi:hypothetical protein